jgi:hypothetical protein
MGIMGSYGRTAYVAQPRSLLSLVARMCELLLKQLQHYAAKLQQ